MAIPGYMWIYDEQGNQINSDSQVSGRENTAEVLGFLHEIYIPSDTDTGTLTGTRKHEPFTVLKTFCPASPILNKACCSGKTLQKVQVSWFRINDAGQEEEYFRHTLSNVKVVSVQPVIDDIKDKSKQTYGHQEKISFRYQTIQWEYLDGNISTDDTWTDKGSQAA